MTGRANGHMIVVAPEADLVTGLDAQFVPQLLGDHDLPLRSDTVSHTHKYNLLAGGAALSVDAARAVGELRPTR